MDNEIEIKEQHPAELSDAVSVINVAAKEGKLDIPHFWRGRNLRIWKGPVIRLIGGEHEKDIQSA